jgi:DMSO/TMAO reductase YedYZ molybdopterin-dependent catalytic subunit
MFLQNAIIGVVSQHVQQNDAPAGDKNIGRRAFLGLIVAGVAAFLLGKEVFPGLTSGGSTATTTAGGSPGAGSSGGADGGGGATKSPTQGFRINTVQKAPAFDPATWKLTVDGLVGTPLTLSWQQFLALPQTTVVRDFLCVEGWGVTGVEWVGVALKDLMERAQVQPKATHLLFHSSDGVYTDSLTVEQAGLADALLVHQVNGVPLPADMGQPVRLIYPGHYGYKYVKWVERVQLLNIKDDPFTGYWESYGYTSEADIS